jgi:hydrogenase nickel incorporation protein HypA/HybF
MHELGIALELLELAWERAEGARVLRVVVEIGELTAVLPEALELAWTVATPDSPLADARLEIARVPGDVLRLREMEVERDVHDVRLLDT